MMKILSRLAAIVTLLLLVVAFWTMPTPTTQAQGGGSWVGQFYNDANFTTFVATASYPNGLNANWGNGAPTDGAGNIIPGVNSDNFTARFTSTISFNAGLYEFVLTADDGARLFINGNLILDSFDRTALSSVSTVVQLTGGAFTLTVEFIDRSAAAVLQLNWFASTGTPAPSATPQPIAVAQVVTVDGLALRTGPYLGGSMVGIARQEKSYPVVAQSNNEGIFTWYLLNIVAVQGTPAPGSSVQQQPNSQINRPQYGWASGRYLVITGDLSRIPFQESPIDTIPLDSINRVLAFNVIGTTRSVMNFRVRPSERTARIGQIPWGAQVNIVGRTVQGGLDFWYLVVYEGRVGWILASYVTVDGLIDAVPIY